MAPGTNNHNSINHGKRINEMALSKKQQRIYDNTNRLLLDELPEFDSLERIGLLTVIADIRPAALFLGTEPSDAQKLARILRASGLSPLVTNGPKMAYPRQSPHSPEILKLFRQEKNRPALWVCRDSEHIPAIKNGINKVETGRLLGYPECCINAHENWHQRFEQASIAAYIRAFGEDSERIGQALVNGDKVKMKWEDGDCETRTSAAFPFVQHIACEACLGSDQSSPTAKLNSQYKQLALDSDPILHDYLLRLAKRRQGPAS